MTGFLAYLARRYGRKAEDVATDVVAYLLTEQIGKDALRSILKGLGYDHVPLQFQPKSRSREDNGIPDLKLVDSTLDEDEKGYPIIIENKFWSWLTSKQPCDYLNCIRPKGLLLFVVPDPRREAIWKKIDERCKARNRPIARNVPTARGCYFGTTGEQFIAVISWTHMLRELERESSKESGRDFVTFVEQLRRLCEVEEKNTIENLDPSVVSNKTIAKSVYDYLKLARQIVEAAKDEQFFNEAKRQKTESSGDWWVGRSGSIGRFRAWIGFDARLWSETGVGPLWVEFADAESLEELRGMLSAGAGSVPCIDDRNNGDPMLVVPIPLEPGVGDDTLIGNAVQRIKELARVLNSARQ